MHIKHRGKVGIPMKREIRSTQTVSRRMLSSVMSINDCRRLPAEAVDSIASAVCVRNNDAVRFIFAQLFFGLFWIAPMPI